LLSLRRCIQKLRKKVRNKARVEAFLVEEVANTLSLYFRPHAPSIRNKVPRYDDCASSFQGTCDLDIFKCLGRCMSPRGVHELSNNEYKVAFLYILTNMPEMDDFFTYVVPKTSLLFCSRFFYYLGITRILFT